MSWTREPPTAAGLWWYLRPVGGRSAQRYFAEVRRVAQVGNPQRGYELCWLAVGGYWSRVRRARSGWWGPRAQPPEPVPGGSSPQENQIFH